MPSLIVEQIKTRLDTKVQETAYHVASMASTKMLVHNKYQIWPRIKRRTPPKLITADNSINSPEKRSPSSLSDNSMPLPAPNLAPVRQIASLSSRRKISVPELRRKPPPENFGAFLNDSRKCRGYELQDICLDHSSATIPGRPATRSEAADVGQHERSSSCPEQWQKRSRTKHEAADLRTMDDRSSSNEPPFLLPASVADWTAFNTTRPLSPIFSPAESTTPIASSREGLANPLQLDTKLDNLSSVLSIPPRKESLRPRDNFKSLTNRTVQTDGEKPSSTSTHDRSSPTRKGLSSSPNVSVAGLAYIPEDAPLVDRGRSLDRADVESKHEASYSSLPKGLRPLEAAMMLPEDEKDTLCKQASSQAEKFEILGTNHVDALSRELRSLEIRCEYLRRTYKSVRSDRQKLQNRLLSYLKSESLVFSKVSLLKQEEAVVELDRAIDEWSLKLEHAENRCLRVRQKLLEHIAASMMLNFANVQPGYGLISTPPRSGGCIDGLDSKNRESIKIYADDQVLGLFTDIEQAIGRMCETPC